MAIVPRLQPSVQDRPIFQQGLTAQATPDDMGAAIGRGLQGLAEGTQRVSAAMAAVRDMEDVARAKEADNQYAAWLRERQYGENGYLTLEGRAAVEGRKTFETEADAKRREFGKGLPPGAASKYDTASQARYQSTLEQSIVHSANARKKWFTEASAARVDTFTEDAIAAYNKPALVNKNIAAGLLEIQEQGQMRGWDDDTLTNQQAEFVSGVHKAVALRMAQDDPLAADAYIKSHNDQLTGPHQAELQATLDAAIDEEHSKREAEAILSVGREAATAPAVRTAGDTGPTNTRAFLLDRLVAGHDTDHVDKLDESFAVNIAAMLQDAPAGIRDGLGILSGYRSYERQAQLWEDALKRYGSPEAARKWVAPPGSSYHNHGQAADLSYNGQSLGKAPKEVQDWVHANASKYGLYFPMGHEPWHVEPMGTRSGTVAPKGNTVAPRSVMPSFQEIEDRLAQIADPRVRDLTRKRLYAMIETQNKAAEQAESAAKKELWRLVDQGYTPDQVPVEVKQAAGMAAVSSAWTYIEAAAKRAVVEDDDVLVYDMRRYAATNPEEFAAVDLNDYRDRLSKETFKELTGLQSSALTDKRKATEDGLSLTTAFSQANDQLEAVGLSTTGKEGSKREDAAKRIAVFQNTLAMQMEEFKRLNEGRNPNQMEIQSLVNRLLLPVVMKGPADLFNWGGTSREGFLFEAGAVSDATTVDVAVKYEDIPVQLRQGIKTDLALELGREPSEEEIVTRYEEFALSR